MNILYTQMEGFFFKPVKDITNITEDDIREDAWFYLKELAKDFNFVISITDGWATRGELPSPDDYAYNIYQLVRKKLNDVKIIEWRNPNLPGNKTIIVPPEQDSACYSIYNPAEDTYAYLVMATHAKSLADCDPYNIRPHTVFVTTNFGFGKKAFEKAYSIFKAK